MDLNPLKRWDAPSGWRCISTVDAHTGGEPLRVVVDGMPDLPRGSALEVRRFVHQRHDLLRKVLMREPRGHADMYGCVVIPPSTEGCHFGVVFLHNEGYSTMCGHGIIAVVKVLVDTGAIAAKPPAMELQIDTPAGVVTAQANLSDAGTVERVTFRNVPSYSVGLDARVIVPGIGPVHYDVAFGGAFYAFVEAAHVGLECSPADHDELVRKGMAIKHAIMNARHLTHPTDPDLAFLYGTIFTGPSESAGVHSRNVCVFADGQIDRSPTGTGVSARAAIHFARGEIERGEWIEIESIIGTRFRVRVVDETRVGPHAAVIPEVEGSAYITGRHQFWLDPSDPLDEGFLVRNPVSR